MINTNMREVATAAVSTLEVNNMNEFETAATKQTKQSPTHCHRHTLSV